MTVDTTSPAGPPPDAAARARSAALEELRRRPVARSWHWDAMTTLLLTLGTTALVIGIAAWCSIAELERFHERALPLALLVALQAMGVFAAIAPGRPVLRAGVALLAVLATAAILVGRGAGLSSATPAIACSASHVAVDLVPLGVVLMSLRRFSWTVGRGLLAGAAAAATGAIAGELSCARGMTHVLLHHVGAGLAIALVCALVSRARRPETFAP
jgi:hypothetical protein